MVAAFYEFNADRIIAEGNQGGDMVRHTIHTEWPEAPVSIVHASRGKAARAEPISALYEQECRRPTGSMRLSGRSLNSPSLGKRSL